ncbi:hypothetical protein ACJJIF_21360 [Microbulbifer sp. SSSA002]|uniref:hypothetical protein n=1 Tax=Microbulbifer sp. SSSA002 TaxID=3243376 RepID=UPI00403947A5
MDVIVDKVNDNDGHSLSIKEVKSIHKFISEKLDFRAKTYRLSNELPEKSRFDRPIKYDMIARKVTICSRGVSKDEIIKEILVEALQHTDSTLRATSYNHLSKAQTKIANERADALYKEYTSEVAG